MKNFIKNHYFLIFSVLTLIISITSWIIAKEQDGATRFLFNQLGYFGPALIAIVIMIYTSNNKNRHNLRSFFPFLIVILCVIIFAILFGDEYYDIKVIQVLSQNLLITITISIVAIYFIFHYIGKKEKSNIDQLVKAPRVKFYWYLIAVALYPVMKFIGLLISIKLFSGQYELPEINVLILIPLFLFAIIFYAAIGEEIGWRGFVLRKMQYKYTPFIATLFIGVVWSLWHIGYFLIVEDYAVQNIPGVVIFTFLSAFFCTWLYNKTNGNVIILILFHASFNFAIIFAPNTLILSILHLILLVVVLTTGKFFKRIKSIEPLI